MQYHLFDYNDRSNPLASGTFEGSFAAEQWARSWAANHATIDDYHIESADSSHKARLFRTVGGQWYIMTS